MYYLCDNPHIVMQVHLSYLYDCSSLWNVHGHPSLFPPLFPLKPVKLAHSVAYWMVLFLDNRESTSEDPRKLVPCCLSRILSHLFSKYPVNLLICLINIAISWTYLFLILLCLFMLLLLKSLLPLSHPVYVIYP